MIINKKHQETKHQTFPTHIPNTSPKSPTITCPPISYRPTPHSHPSKKSFPYPPPASHPSTHLRPPPCARNNEGPNPQLPHLRRQGLQVLLRLLPTASQGRRTRLGGPAYECETACEFVTATGLGGAFYCFC